MSKKEKGRMTFRRSLPRSVRHFSRDGGGNVAMLMALMAVPILGAVGLAVDHTMAGTSQMALDNAADAAALSAITRAKAVYTSEKGSTRSAIDEGIKAGSDQFLGNASKLPYTRVDKPKIALNISGRTFTAKVTWSGRTKSNFGSFFGVNTIALKGTSEASQRLPAYTKIIIVLDNSSSMGIGVNHAEQVKLHNVTGCSVGCHVATPDKLFQGKTLYTWATEAGVRMRIDVMRDALINLVREIATIETSPDLFKFGVYTFSSDLSTVLDIDDRRSSDKKYVEDRLSEIKLTSEGGGTNFGRALIRYSNNEGSSNRGANIADIIAGTNRGDGSSVDRPLVYVLLLTDGVEDYLTFDDPPNSPKVDPNFRQVQPYAPLFDQLNGRFHYGIQALDDGLCQVVKNRGGPNVKIMTLQATYIVPAGYLDDDDSRFGWINQTLLRSGVLDSRMRACASGPKLSFKGTTPEEITGSMRAMFELAVPLLTRLTK